MLWAPLRKPHENALDPHWLARNSCADVEHPELGRSFRYATSKWLSTATVWPVGRRAPQLNEDEATVTEPPQRSVPVIAASPTAAPGETLSPRGKPFPLHGIRILDFTWFLASAGGTRFLSAFGAESIKVELKSHPDTRMAAMAPMGGRAAAASERFRYGRPVQQQKSRQTRHLAKREAPQGARDRQALGGHVGYRSRRLFTGGFR